MEHHKYKDYLDKNNAKKVKNNVNENNINKEGYIEKGFTFKISFTSIICTELYIFRICF